MIYLKAADLTAMQAAMDAAGVRVDDGHGNMVPAPGLSIVDLGTLYDHSDPENPVALPGHHCNVLGELSSAQASGLAAVTIDPPPETPAATGC